MHDETHQMRIEIFKILYIYYKYLNNEILAFLFSKQFDTNMKNPWKKLNMNHLLNSFKTL